MTERHCRRHIPAGRRSVSALAVVAAFTIGMGSSSVAWGSPSQHQFRPVSMTMGVSLLRHAGITTQSGDGASDLAIDLGIAQLVGRKVLIEVGGMVSTPWDDIGSFSIFAARAEARFYPTLGRSQSDHVYFVLGVILATHSHESRGSRIGGGPEFGLGTDIFVGEANTIYVQFSAAALFMSEGSTLTNAGCMLDSYPFGSGFLRLAIGTRLGL